MSDPMTRTEGGGEAMKKKTTTPRGDGFTPTPGKNVRLRLQTLRTLDSAELRLVQGGLLPTEGGGGGGVSREPEVAC
jgi:hypothetical protein